jgi:hypothetical protein
VNNRQRCFVQTDEFEPQDTVWAEIKHLPGIHVVGKTENGFVELAIAESYIPWLINNHLPFYIFPCRDADYDVAKPTKKDKVIWLPYKWEILALFEEPSMALDLGMAPVLGNITDATRCVASCE